MHADGELAQDLQFKSGSDAGGVCWMSVNQNQDGEVIHINDSSEHTFDLYASHRILLNDALKSWESKKKSKNCFNFC